MNANTLFIVRVRYCMVQIFFIVFTKSCVTFLSGRRLSNDTLRPLGLEND